MVRMETECDMDFWKSVRMTQKFTFGSKIIEVVQKWCCIADVLQDIGSHYINEGTIPCIYNSFKQLYRDSVPWGAPKNDGEVMVPV